MERIEQGGVTFLSFANLIKYHELAHGVSLQPQLDFRLDQPGEQWRQRLEMFAGAVGLAGRPVVRAGQVHGCRVARVVGDEDVATDTDGLCTNAAGTGLLALGADCPLILLYDPVRRAVGIGHGGWRGTVQGIAGNLVMKMMEEFGTAPSDLVGGIGPCICGRCYEVGDDVAEQVRERLTGSESFLRGRGEGHWLLDLAQANKAQLVEVGLLTINVEISGGCTYEDREQFPSYRRDGAAAGRLGLLAGIIA